MGLGKDFVVGLEILFSKFLAVLVVGVDFFVSFFAVDSETGIGAGVVLLHGFVAGVGAGWNLSGAALSCWAMVPPGCDSSYGGLISGALCSRCRLISVSVCTCFVCVWCSGVFSCGAGLCALQAPVGELAVCCRVVPMLTGVRCATGVALE